MAKRYQDELREVIEVLHFEMPADLPKRKTAKVSQYHEKVLAEAKRRGLSAVQIAQIHNCLDNPVAKKDLFAQYNKFRVKEAESNGETAQELTSERSYIVAEKFLRRWESEGVAAVVPNGGSIPGFDGYGQAAAAGLLEELRKDLPEANSRERPLPEAPAEGVPGE